MPSPHDPAPVSRRTATVPVVVAIVAALVAAFTFLAARSSDAEPAASQGRTQTSSRAPERATSPKAAPKSEEAPQVPSALARRAPGDPMARGDVDAPVVMVNFSEFQCPFCGKFARDTEPDLVRKYVNNGTLRIEWRDFPYLGEESYTAALAGRAAAEQDGFWEFHDAMYAEQSPPNSGALTVDHLVAVAESVGLDGDRLRTDMRDPALAAGIRKDFQEGQSIGVSGTPAFLINGRPVIGAQPAKVFRQAIEQAAAEAS
ncbi:MAG TPA: thioredoxin domain-containing protein [Segeticoccus sp.]|uniref:DsbA family protein n=1 Tax=Segeticoccus sp. TaxID=2706531 RepID=UPI002D7E734C|nr:thioredoxin domain-containing protein [Segeticoccus sp.]HET8601812.1 thioredoxin domain-containing protein [Segeticoccus sp.]